MRALLIDESRSLRTMMKVVLRRSDIEFIEADIDIDPAGIGEVQLVVVGAQFPIDPAVQLIEHFADQKTRPAIIAFTTDHVDHTFETLVEAGADRVLTMPFITEEFRIAACTSTRERGYL